MTTGRMQGYYCQPQTFLQLGFNLKQELNILGLTLTNSIQKHIYFDTPMKNIDNVESSKNDIK